MDQKNFILFIAISFAILFAWSALFPQQPQQNSQPVTQTATAPELAPGSGSSEAAMPPAAAPGTPSPAPVQAPVVAEPANLSSSTETFSLSNDLIQVKLNANGWFTHAYLKKYRESIDTTSEQVAVLNIDENHAVYINSGVMGARQLTPFSLAKQADDTILLRSELEGGRIWERSVSLQQGSYLVTVQDKIINGGGLKMYRQVVERNPDTSLSNFYEHMGPTALLNDKLVEADYDELDEKGAIRQASVGGWTAIMNRYFIAAIISNPEQDYPYYFKSDGRSYQAGLIDDGKLQGHDMVFNASLYIGPKSIPVLEQANAGLERSVDFGWFKPIAEPMHTFLGWLFNYLGNYGWCIIVLVIFIKILFFYPTQKSYESMAGMRKLQPEMNRLKELYGDDKQRMGQEMMELYKKHKVNPMGGCLPIIIQIPVFFALYKVLLMSIEVRQAPFIGWIEDMSVQDPYFVLPVLMGISMYIQQKLNPQPADEMQAKIMQFLPVVFTVMFLFFPAGLVLYWVVNNILSIIQQRLVMKRMKVD